MIRRARWKRRKRPDGTTTLELRPAPRLRTLTLDIVERGCAALGVSADDVLQGRVDSAALSRPPLAHAEAFLAAVLTNADAYRVRDWPLDRLDAMLGLVVADFFAASAGISSRPRLLATA